eukprot:TRINITY_DN19328_c0_g1_i1.p1 TRINITY_DN19328_c0_g1~~TRINITY_DN19328_c0_g1_i1.p1  ORF type:complete len:459 (+),score=104.34 TRINITY_DN19328_c0_g1_i1:209-1585(+)
MESGFTWREVDPGLMKLWLAIQVIGLLFQYLLWNEVSGHLSDFEDVLARECAPERLVHGVCHGPMWNITSWQDFVLASGTWGAQSEYSFSFYTTSVPPTFVLVVDPVSQAKASGPHGGDDNSNGFDFVIGGASLEPDPSPAPLVLSEQEIVKGARCTVDVRRTNPPQVGPGLHKSISGMDALTFKDASAEAARAGRVEWRATVSSPSGGKKTRYVAFVEDSQLEHLAAVHASEHCGFGRSWKAFNQQRQGHAHRALSWCQWLLGLFLFVGAAAAYAVHMELSGTPLRLPLLQGDGEGPRLFHRVVLLKFILVDMPQQICMVLYVLGWYDAAGLRCQLCMFYPTHCSAETAFHFSNTMAIVCTLLSSLANQLLVRPILKKTYTEEDICIRWCVRAGGCCFAVLPFTTGLLVATRGGAEAIMPAAIATRVLLIFPCIVGWLGLFCALCVPLIACCEYCDD